MTRPSDAAAESVMLDLSRNVRVEAAQEWKAMGVLTSEMKRVVEQQRLGFVATVCPDGTPNLSPKGTTAVWDDDHLVFANIRSPGTVSNLRRNPNVEVNVVDPFVRKGYRFKGVGSILESGPLYDRLRSFYQERGSRNAIREIVMIRVDAAQPIDSPAYDLGFTEEDVRDRWERHYDSLRSAGTEECVTNTISRAASVDEIVALERAALDRWGNGDPGGFLELYADDITYFDPMTAARLDGHAAMEDYYRPWVGKIHVPRYEMRNPSVVASGDLALLTYNLVNYITDANGTESAGTCWNSTTLYRRADGVWKAVHSHWSFTRHPAFQNMSPDGSDGPDA